MASKQKADLKGLAARESGGRTINAREEDARFLEVIQRLRDGQSIRGACGLAQFPRTSLYEWMNKDSKIKELVETALDEGFGTIELKLMQSASQTDDVDWRAISWVLARRFPDEYGEKKEVEIKAKVADGIPEVIAMIEQTNEIIEDKSDD